MKGRDKKKTGRRLGYVLSLDAFFVITLGVPNGNLSRKELSFGKKGTPMQNVWTRASISKFDCVSFDEKHEPSGCS